MFRIIYLLFFSLFVSQSALADRVSCIDVETGVKYLVLFDIKEMKAFGKTFQEIVVQENSITGTYNTYQNKLLGGKEIDSYWKFELQFDGFSKQLKGKYIDGNHKLMLEKYYKCS